MEADSIDRREVLRYLGYRGHEADERVNAWWKGVSGSFLTLSAPDIWFGNFL